MEIGRRTVLVVDDEPGIRSLVALTLSRAGYLVLVAGSGAEAARADGPIDLLLCDVRLPGEYGPDIGSALLRRHPAMRVVYLSGADRLIGPPPAHAYQFLGKPFALDELVATVAAILREPRPAGGP